MKKLAITMGDPAGIGPEICCKAVCDELVLSICEPVVIGSKKILSKVAEKLNLELPKNIIEPEAFDYIPSIGKIDAKCGEIAFSCVSYAIKGCLSGEFDGIVTAPINKKALDDAGISLLGHTEMLGHFCGIKDQVMLLYDDSIAVALVTCHQSLKSISDGLTTKKVVRAAELLDENIAKLKNKKPRLAMLGLNPHAGENGVFGREEIDIIEPAVDIIRKKGIDISDILPPDTAFMKSNREKYDAFVCQYHDQALIPFKALAFEDGVNVTMGIPIVRTSVDHGTAFDLAWQGKADYKNLVKAIELATKLIKE